MRLSLGLVRVVTTAALLAATPGALSGQVVITLQGGVHLGGVEPPAQSLQQATGGRATAARGVTGEATSAGTRIGIGVSRDWILDGGVAWSHNSSRSATVGQPTPPIGPRTLFASSTIQTRLTNPANRLLLLGGIGPALIFERGDGTPATRHTNVGGLATLGAVLRLDTRTALRLDAQQYFFSGDIADGYTPHLGTTPLRSAGTRARHDFVLLAGVSWRAD
ncbi:MAG TPA: hypothetical protein VM387_00840 [Gemmatimonadales bacterium]|nr:hypothetical protein [Gemmatimonadales bacterium]